MYKKNEPQNVQEEHGAQMEHFSFQVTWLSDVICGRFVSLAPPRSVLNHNVMGDDQSENAKGSGHLKNVLFWKLF